VRLAQILGRLWRAHESQHFTQPLKAPDIGTKPPGDPPCGSEQVCHYRHPGWISIPIKRPRKAQGRAVAKNHPAMKFGSLQMHGDRRGNGFEFAPFRQIGKEGAKGRKRRKSALVHEGVPDH
jgi:hypothetical protein